MFLKSVSFNFGTLDKKSYLNDLPYALCKEIIFHKNIIFLTGDNGVGKSTLLESLAYFFNMNREGGSSNFILDQENIPKLFPYIKVPITPNAPFGFFFRSDTFFSIEEVLEEYGEDLKYQYNGGEKTFDMQSHGEGFMNFFKDRTQRRGIYFFDEPENALSFENQILFLFLLKEFEIQGSQVIIVTHSPVLLSYPNAQIISITKEGIENVPYEDTNQFTNYKNFFENYKSYQKQINDFD
jgi:predicted ATPase